MAYSLLILDRLVLCQCYRDNSFPGGVHVFLQRPSEIIKRLKCGRGIRSEIRVGSQRILERTINTIASDSVIFAGLQIAINVIDE